MINIVIEMVELCFIISCRLSKYHLHLIVSVKFIILNAAVTSFEHKDIHCFLVAQRQEHSMIKSHETNYKMKTKEKKNDTKQTTERNM